MLVLLRSLIFMVVFYAMTLVFLVAALPTFFMTHRQVLGVAREWARVTRVLLRTICGTHVEVRGAEKIPPGGLLVASKHQSAWETFNLLLLFDDPLYILKRELQWIPIFGWLLWKARMVPVDRDARAKALSDMRERARAELADGRQIIIFPEGTRRPPGAEPKYKSGVAHLYTAFDVPCVPIALNAGLFWPRRSLLRRPGTIVVEVLDPIPPGLPTNEFFTRLRNDIETATARLVGDGRRELAAKGIAAP